MPLSASGVQAVKSILDGVTSEGKSGAPGLVFVAVDKSGATLVEHASGTIGVDSKTPVDLDTTYWIASTTKIVTAIAALQLNEQGKLPLDDADFVKKIAPELAAKEVFADGITAAKQEKPITVRMLLSHTAGFGYSFQDPRVQVNEIEGGAQAVMDSPLVNQPGSVWEYGVNLDWAGIIVERVAGVKLGVYFKEHIFKPLGIQDAAFVPSKEMKANMVTMHRRDVEGSLSEIEPVYLAPLTVETKEQEEKLHHAGGHGLYAKPKEYVKILAALLNDGTSPTTGGKILKPETVNSMFENQIPDQPDFARNVPAPAIPALTNHTPELYPQEGNPPQGWGLSFLLTLAPGATGRGANTGFWAGLANLFYWVDREKGVAGIIAGQVVPFGDAKILGAWFLAEKAVYDGLEK
ncbi:beta-lactamase/transpeptidase-like protein [Pleomassaria siparia CBS 279.74]|uniref:Beta-lactamase/transpeptidase-like protein n=1 Tax=Pleomassaria siparia CBS 279.74 TaxID=1314801 RepID=A0A6G1JTT5_9PLEO|nr:beta-lactamase/transpeptidase-like protein [Pleomassaria siparia CBS 279.74]